MLLILPILSQGVHALSAPSVTFIPTRFTTNASFIAVADVVGQGSVRISWIVPGTNNFGQFPNAGNTYTCYFSNFDPDNTCGPYPLIAGLTGNLTFRVLASDAFGGTSERDVNVDVGSVQINPLVQVNGNNVSIVVFPNSPVTSIQYAVYKADLALLNNYKSMVCEIKSGSGYQCIADTMLNDGEYLVAFTATSDTGFGGNVRKVVVGSPAGPANATPSRVRADPVEFAALINSNQLYEVSNFRIVNLENANLTGLSVSVPLGLRSILSIVPQSTTIPPLGSTLFAVRLSNINSPTGIFTYADVLVGTEKVGIIPVNITVSVKDVSAPSGIIITASPGIFSGDYAFAVEGVSEEFTITNRAGEPITTFGQPVYIGNIQGIASITSPSSIQPGGTGTVSVMLKPASPGPYQGSIEIPTDRGIISIPVSVRFFSDIGPDIEDASSSLEDFTAGLSDAQLQKLELALGEVQSDIDSAQSSSDLGDYERAELDLRSAESKLAMLQLVASEGTTEAGPPLDLSLALPVVLIIVVVVLLVVAFKKLRKKKAKAGEGEEGEEFEEDMEAEEEF